MRKFKNKSFKQEKIDKLELERVFAFDKIYQNKKGIKLCEKIRTQKIEELKQMREFLINNKPEYIQRLDSWLGKGEYNKNNSKFLEIQEQYLTLGARFAEEEKLSEKEEKIYKDRIDITKDDLTEAKNKALEEDHLNDMFIDMYVKKNKEYKTAKKEYKQLCSDIARMEKENVKTLKKVKKTDKRIKKLQK